VSQITKVKNNKIVILPDISRHVLSSLMHILRLYTTTVLSFINTGLSL